VRSTRITEPLFGRGPLSIGAMNGNDSNFPAGAILEFSACGIAGPNEFDEVKLRQF